jgi:hypothetical protein
MIRWPPGFFVSEHVCSLLRHKRMQNTGLQTRFFDATIVQYTHLTPVRDRPERVHTFKESEMNQRVIWMLSAALLSGASMTAIAAQHGMDMHPAHRSGAAHQRGHGAEAQLAKLESALKLEDAQRPAWNAFVKDIQELARAREKQHEGMREAMHSSKDTQAVGAIERMDAMSQRLQNHQAHLSQMKQATQTLLARLNPAQQSVFNAEWVNWMGREGRPQRGHSGHQDHRESRKG